MRLLVVLFMLLGLSMVGNCQTRRALLIGVGKYAEGTGWKEIHGDKDVEKTANYLVKNGFDKANISKLVNEQATYDNIRREFRIMRDSAKVGDLIFILFAGHGQLVKDLSDDEDDGYDESWVPYDAAMTLSDTYDGSHHLVDDQINNYLAAIKDRIRDEGKILVISDACHSGDVTMGDDDEDDDVVRGADTPLEITNPDLFPMTHLVAKNWVAISACGSNEMNMEYNREGRLVYTMRQIESFLSLFAADADIKVREYMKRIPHKSAQTPVTNYIKNLPILIDTQE